MKQINCRRNSHKCLLLPVFQNRIIHLIQYPVQRMTPTNVSKTAIIDAIARMSCFNLIHLPSSFKVDVFVLKKRPFGINSMNRAVAGKIDLLSNTEFPIASPEDTILSMLEWYRLGNEASERQWEDVVRVMKVLGDQADRNYLLQNADDLKVVDLVQKLLIATS